MRSFIGALVGAAVAALIAPLTRGWFSVPSGGVGFVTVNHYPKGFDYAVIALLFAGAAAGAWILSRPSVPSTTRQPDNRTTLVIGLVVFVLMIFIHDHPYAFMDPFHEGEYLTPAFLLRDGGRPYRDVFFFHGLATDGGLDSLILGDPPSPRRERRLETLLDAATLALLVPIAAEVCATTSGMAMAVLASLCAIGAGEISVFPYFRLAPLLLATLGLLRFARTRTSGALVLAACASTLGILWSVDTGTYAVAATAILVAVMRPRSRQILIAATIAITLPLLVLFLVRADVRQFFIDSYITIPSAADANASLPARTSIDLESARYYFPPIFYGWLLIAGIRRRDLQMVIVAVVSIILFRTPAGRCSWSHLRFGIPLIGIALVAFVIEPAFVSLRSRWSKVAFATMAVILFGVYVELIPNVVAASKFLVSWRARQSHAGQVPYPLATGRGIYTTAQNAADLAALNGLLANIAPPGAPIFDLSNELALYYLFQRRPAVRCPSVPMLAAPRLTAEALAELEVNPPACVIVEGLKELSGFDGVPNTVRVRPLFDWVDAHYPRRIRAGRFLVAIR